MTKETWKYIRSILPSVLLMLTAGCFTACSSDGDSEESVAAPKQRAFVFGGSISEMQHSSNRAGNPLHELVGEFHVWGYKTMSYDDADASYGEAQLVFPGYTVEHSAGTGIEAAAWNYVNGTTQTIKYWDYSAKSYRFMAVTGDFANISHSTSEDASTGATFASTTVRVSPDDGVYFSKLWFSNNAIGLLPAYGQTVVLNFCSPFCKVRFMFVDGQGNALDAHNTVVHHVKKGSIRFSEPTDTRKLAYEGNVSLLCPITGTQTTETFTFEGLRSYDALTVPYESQSNPDDYAFVSTTADNEKWYTLLPNKEGRDFEMSLTYNGAERKAVVPAAYMVWEMNYEYTYVFKLTETKVEFAPQLSVFKEWQSGYVPDAPVEW